MATQYIVLGNKIDSVELTRSLIYGTLSSIEGKMVLSRHLVVMLEYASNKG